MKEFINLRPDEWLMVAFILKLSVAIIGMAVVCVIVQQRVYRRNVRRWMQPIEMATPPPPPAPVEKKKFYKIKASSSHRVYEFAHTIGCGKRSDWLNKLPYDSVLGENVRVRGLEWGFEIIEE